MTISQPPNPITQKPFTGIGEFDTTARVLADMAAPDFPLVTHPNLRMHQAKALLRSTGVSVTPDTERKIVEAGVFPEARSRPLSSVIDVVPVDEARGGIDPRIERLYDQGQATPADGIPRTGGDRFARLFYDWRPHSKGETTLATKGLGRVIDEVRHIGLAPVKDQVKKAERFLTSARIEAEALSVLEGREADFDSREGAARLIRSDEGAIGVIVEERADAIQFESGKWLKPGYQPYQELVKSVRAEIVGLDDEDLLTAFRTTRQAVESRALFWSQQLSGVKEDPQVEAALLAENRSH